MPTTSTAATVRRLPMPACEPPFDDEVGGSVREHPTHHHPVAGAVQGTLALSFVLPSGVASAPAVPASLHLVPRPASEPTTTQTAPPAADAQLDGADFGPQPTGRADLPDPRGWTGRLVQAVIEVMAGDRPVGQLVRWTSAQVYDEVACRILPPPPAPSRGGSRTGPVALGAVRSVHVSEPADGIAEAVALVRRGARTTAVALRLEGLDGRWQCTALELG